MSHAIPDTTCELDCNIGPDADRVIRPPVRTPQDKAAFARMRRWVLARIAGAYALLAGVLALFGASCFRP